MCFKLSKSMEALNEDPLWTRNDNYNALNEKSTG